MHISQQFSPKHFPHYAMGARTTADEAKATTDAKNTELAKQGMKLLLIEDHQAIVDGVLHWMGSDYEVLVARNVEMMRELMAQHVVHVAVIDLRFPEYVDGLKMMPLLRQAGLPFLVFSGTADEWHIRAAVRMGASGYVDKRLGLDVLRHALRVVETGGFHFPADFMARLRQDTRAQRTNLPHRLGESEIAVLNAILELSEPGGNTVASNEAIAQALHLSVGRVSNIFLQLFDKFRVQGGRKALLQEIKARGYYPGVFLGPMEETGPMK